MAINNPVSIEDFPTTDEILSSDKIIVFTNDGDTAIPQLIDITSLSSIMTLLNGLNEISSKISKLENKYKDIERSLNNTYMTSSQISAQYSTISNFNEQISKLEMVDVFKYQLSSKADTTYLEANYNALKAKCQDMKKILGSGNWKNEGEKGKGYKLLMVGKALEGPG